MDGSSLGKLRGVYGKKDLPVLLFTASPSVEEKIIQLNDPWLGVLQKPVSIDELRIGLGKFLGPQSRFLSLVRMEPLGKIPEDLFYCTKEKQLKTLLMFLLW
jgi:hypothetical protein